MFSSPCCKRSLVIVVLLSCVWHLDSGTMKERPQEQVVAPATFMTVPEKPAPPATGFSSLLSKIKDVFADEALSGN